MFEVLQNKPHSWSLYFYTRDRRKNNPYTVSKMRFKNASYLSEYSKDLINCIREFQLNKIESVQIYDGNNSKISCDKVNLKNEIINEQWENFIQKVATASDTEIKGKYQGYIIVAQPSDETSPSVTFVKTSNPIIQLVNKRSIFYKRTSKETNELDQLSDDICRLYLTSDFVIFGENLYAFTHTFEDLFYLEKTLQKIKHKGIEKIVSVDSISNIDLFKSLASSYKSPRTFLTLKDERIERIADKQNRKTVSKMLNIKLDNNSQFIIESEEEAAKLIKYLCYKIFQDHESRNVLEASVVSKIK